MQLSDLRAEVLAKGFDASLFPTSRLNQFINDYYLLIATRVNYYVDEATQDFSTVQGVSSYAFPTDFARIRNLRDTNRNLTMQPVSLRRIDNSGPGVTGTPNFYALDAANFHLWPTPDGVYPMECRYWKMPALLVNDTDVPVFPARWHHLLWRGACAECYKSEDDLQTGGAWEQSFEKYLAEFAADVKFPDTETPSVARSYWDADAPLQQRGWSVWGWY